MTTLVTDRLTLRPPQQTDAAALVVALNNLNVSRWTGRIPYPYGPEDAEAFLSHHLTPKPDELMLCIVCAGELIGGIGIGFGELGYWIAERHWGHGFATEAARAVLRHAFTEMARADVTASYFTGNAPSRRILEGLGFTETGLSTAFSKARREEVALVNLVLTREAWEKRQVERRP